MQALTADSRRVVFVTGGTGYLGTRLIPKLIERGHPVHALVRSGSESRLPPGCTVVTGDALHSQTFANRVRGADTFVHLVGVSSPTPWKAKQFQDVDLASVRASIDVARNAKVAHFVYVSVAQPAPVMKAYIRIRAECEALIRTSGLHATILRPWYVLGPGHRWPTILLPIYWLLERLPQTQESSRRLGLVTLDQMIHALIEAIEHPTQVLRIIDVSQIRNAIRCRGR